MKICLITPAIPPHGIGGIGTYVLELAQGFHARGHEVTVAGYRIHPAPRIQHDWGESVSLGLSEPLPLSFARMLDGAGALNRAVDRMRTQRIVWRISRARGRSRMVARARAGARAVRRFLLAEGNRFDIIEISNYLGHGAGVPPVRGRYVVRLSTPGQDTDAPGARAITAMERASCRRASLLISHSRAMQQKGVEVYGLAGQPMTVISLGLGDVARVADRPSPAFLDLLVLGRAEHRKGTDLLIRALPQALAADSRLRVTFAGADVERFSLEDVDVRATWRSVVEHFPDRITVKPEVVEAEKLQLLAGSHWLVVASRFESFGLVAIEAMRAGTPVSAAASGGLIEVCGVAPVNRIFAPNDPAALAAELAELSRIGPERALTFRPAARMGYEQHFRAERMIDESLDAYHRAMGRSPPR